jgi:N6-L-threonylcarbamoyladenine synthase
VGKRDAHPPAALGAIGTTMQGAGTASDTLVLGIETSCDETAAAVVARAADGKGRILSSVIRAQWEHGRYGGVVPEIAARAHVECLDEIIAEALRAAGTGLPRLSAVAVTAGPGLIGGLIVGVVTAEALAAVHGLPLVAVNHLEAHALTVGLTEGLRPPYLLLLISGGHTQLLTVQAVGRYRRLATTIDDALGEAFDKTAKLLGLGYPGGPAVERMARRGRAGRFALPRPMLGRSEPHFSFAGLKTAVRQQARAAEPLGEQEIADLCAEFQAAVADSLAERVRHVLAVAPLPAPLMGRRRLVVAGGVAANQALKGALAAAAAEEGYQLTVPPPQLCTDNAAMVAWAGAERFACGWTDAPPLKARARWPLDPLALPALGGGRLGAKA